MDRRLLIIINLLAIILVVWLGTIAWQNISEASAMGISSPSALGLLLIILIILISLGYIDIRKRLLDFVYAEKRPADSGLDRYLRLSIKIVNAMTVLLAVLIWTFAWFYMREQLFPAVLFSGYFVVPAVCLNILLLIGDYTSVREDAVR